MIAEEQERPSAASLPARFRWWRLLFGILLAILAIWYTTREVALGDLVAALIAANPMFLIAGLFTILLTTVAKAWRWQLLFLPSGPLPRWRDVFWALMLGQYVNVLLWRAGDLARVYDLDSRAGRGKAPILTTVIVEKSLDLVLLAVTLVAALPFVLLPEDLRNPSLTVSLLAVALFGTLYVLAYQTDLALRLTQRAVALLPLALAKRVMGLASGGLAGLAALRNRRLTLLLLIVTTLIAGLSVLTPLVLFPAFDIPFGFVEALLLHLVLSAGSAPPTTPARLGVFEWLVVLLLERFGGVGDTIMIGYALVFHAVILVPQIVFGSLAASRSQWKWRSGDVTYE